MRATRVALHVLLLLLCTTTRTHARPLPYPLRHKRTQRLTASSLTVLTPPRLDPTALHLYAARCRCAVPHASFEARYRASFIVVRAKVIRWTEHASLSRRRAVVGYRPVPQFVIRHYVLEATALYKGAWPTRRSYFQAQGFVHADVCGLSLEVGRQYLFNMDDPATKSPASVWSPGIFVIDRCQRHYGWRSLSKHQLFFLFHRARQ